MFESEVEAFCSMQQSPRTQSEYRKDLARWYSSGRDLTVQGVALYKEDLSQYKAASAGRFWSTARSFHRWLVTRGMLNVSPFESVKAPKRTSMVVDVPSDDDINALFQGVRTPRERKVLALLLHGLRASEAAGTIELRLATGQGWYMIVTGKGDKERIVPVMEGSYLMDIQADDSPLTYDMVNNIIDDIARRVGVKTHPHALRHHYATRLIRAGANVFAVQKLLGHATVATTQQYVTMDLTDLFEATSRDPKNLGGIHIVRNLEADPRTGTDASRDAAYNVASAGVR